MADDFLKHEGVEMGYFDKRKDQFNQELIKGVASTGVNGSVKSKPKHRSNSKKTEEKVTGKLPVNRKQKEEKAPGTTMSKAELLKANPADLKGADFAERMRLAREAKK